MARRTTQTSGIASKRMIVRAGPSFDHEQAALDREQWPVAGIDEAGRGPWAGPVVAAAVILDPSRIPEGLDDSKVIEPAKREALFAALHASGACIGVGIAGPDRIDAMNILRATFWAMQQALDHLAIKPGLVLVDGNRAPQFSCPALTIVGGDAASLTIAAASIVAKVTRDRLMIELASQFPVYGFERHKGYGTPEHAAALSTYGATAHHRRSFKPVRDAMANVADQS